jgi:hypothetical protein
MTPYEKIKPKYVPSWFAGRLEIFKKYAELRKAKMDSDPGYHAKKDEIAKNSESWRFSEAQYLTDREQKEENRMRELEVEREKLRALISMDYGYQETVPFADYYPFPQVSRPKSELKGLSMGGSGSGTRSQAQLDAQD